MGLEYISGDGGTLPGGGAAPAAASLLDNYPALPSGQRADFRAAIAPRRWVVASAALVSLLAEAVAGDTASVAGSGDHLYLLTSNTPATPAHWINMLTNTAAPSPS